MGWISLRVLAVLTASAAPQAAQTPKVADEVVADARREHDSLVAAGYNVTQGWKLVSHPEKTTTRHEVIVPEEDGEHSFTLWGEVRQGQLSLRLLGPDGAVRTAWSGRKGEATTSFPAALGTYVVEIDQPAGSSGFAILGIKGPALHRCEIENGLMEEHAASPAKGFNWPYLLWRPKEARAPNLLVLPNNTGFTSEDLTLLRASASCEIQRQSTLATRLGAPILVPLFPRPVVGQDDLYLQALTRSSLETSTEKFRRVDQQLIAMIDDAKAALHSARVEIGPKVLLWGFSASGSFVNRFAMLHPDRVRAVASGSPGGWPLAPTDESGGDKLTYPVGVGDLHELVGTGLDIVALKQVSWLFFMGDQDKNDAVVFRDSFSKAQEEIIFRHFGPTPVSRWTKAEGLYKALGLEALFKLYPGAAHSVTPEMDEDIALFFEKAIGHPSGR